MPRAPFGAVLRHIRKLVADAPTEEASDDQLLARFVARRDESAFTALVRRHGPLVYGACCRILSNPSDADDVFQATFLVLVRRAASVRKAASVGSWLYGVARRTALKLRTAALRRHARESEAPEMSASCPEPSLDDSEMLRLLEEEIDALPEEYRAPLVLCYLQGRTHAQAAQELGRSVGSMSRCLRRARELLRGRLTQRGVVLSAAAVAALTADLAVASGIHHPSAALTEATVRTAVLLNAGAGCAVPSAFALAEQVARDMTLSRLRSAPAWLVALSVLLVGTGLVLRQVGAEPPPGPQKPAPAETATADAEPLPLGAIARLGTLRMRHGQAITGLSYSRDGKTLASSSWDRTVSLWDVETGKELRRLEGHAELVRCVALSQDGKYVASGAKDFRIWDAATGKELFRSAPLDGNVWGVAFSPDGKRVCYVGQDSAVGGVFALLAVPPAVAAEPAPAHEGVARAVAFAPDGKTLATVGDDSLVRLWDAASGQEISRLAGHTASVQSVAFSPDGKYVASGAADGTARIWDAATGKELQQFAADVKGNVTGVAFAPDGKSLAASLAKSRRVCVYNLVTGKETHSLPGGWFRCVTFAPDGKTLAGGDGHNAVLLWSMPDGKLVHPADGHPAGVQGLALSPSGQRLAAGTHLRTVHHWDATTGKLLGRFEGHGHGVYPVAYSPDGKRIASGSRDGTARVWDAATGKQLHELFGYDGEKPTDVWVYGVAFSPDGKRLAAACKDAIVRVWDVERGTEVCRCMGHASFAYAVAFAPDGNTLYSVAEDGGIRVWDPANGRPLRSFGDVAWFGESLAVSPDGRVLATGCRDGYVRLFDTRTGQPLRELKEHANFAVRQRFFRDGRILAFSPDGCTIASGSWQVVQLWEVATGKERLAFTAHRGEAASVVFFPDGRRMATSSPDTTVMIWDLAERASLRGEEKPDPKALWARLVGGDAAVSYRAMWALAASPTDAMPLLKEHLTPAPPADEKRLGRLIRELDADDFDVREKATEELGREGAVAAAQLRRALQGEPPPEAKRRLERLLEKITSYAPPEQLADARALELLEHLDTPEARALLAALAAGAPGAARTEDAKAALARRKAR